MNEQNKQHEEQQQPNEATANSRWVKPTLVNMRDVIHGQQKGNVLVAETTINQVSYQPPS